MRPYRLITLWGILLVAFGGCAGKGERIDVSISAKQTATGTISQTNSSLRVAVLPFEDGRSQGARLGTRSHLRGGESYFELPNGNVSEATAQALVDYLTRRGWQAYVSRRGTREGADVTIYGKIVDLSVDANSGVGHTDIAAKNILLLQAMNHVDESVLRETLTGTGSDQVFWFEPQDGQNLLNELFEKNFDKLLADTRIEGRTLRLR